MNYLLNNNDKKMFYKYLKNINIYFEYGSGESTYQASILNNIKKIYSVESDIQWQNKLKQKITKHNINYIYHEINSKLNTYDNNIQKKNYSNKIKDIINNSNKIAFIRGSVKPYDETMSGFGGTQLCVLNIAKELTKKYDVYIVHNKRKNNFIGNSGIKYVNKINESLFRVIIDVRYIRDKFLNNVKYIHWIHDPWKYNESKSDTRLIKYNYVISLTKIQKLLWDKKLDTFNFKVINNPFILESVKRNKKYNKFKIIAFSAKTNWNKCVNIVKKLRIIDKRFTLHICSPSYKNISKKLNQYNFVVNHGSLSHDKMMKLLSDAFLCLYPTSFQENCPGICYECMYYGVPMLTEYVSGSGLNEIIPKNLILPSNCNINIYIYIILNWYKNNTRPKLVWNERNDEIYKQWEQLIENDNAKNIDLVLINGRFRVACCLKCYDIIKEECLIAFNDFLNRPCYNIILEYFDIIEKTIDNKMVILKKKNVNIPKELIKKYELIAY